MYVKGGMEVKMKISSILKGTVLSCIITVITVFIASVITYFTDVDAKTLSICVYGGMLLGVIAGAFGAAKGANSRRFINGMVSGALFFLLLAMVSFAVNGKIALSQRLYLTAGGILAAALLGAYLGREK